MQPAFVALVLFVVYMTVAFGLRTVQHIRATGSTGFQGISGRIGSASWFGGVLFVLALVLGALAPVLELAGVVRSLVALPPWAFACAVALAVAGTLATYASQVAMGKSWRIGVREAERTELVSDGPFRIVRNPIFSCMLVTGTGLALILPNVLSLVSLICLFVAVELQVRVVEEPYLHRTHGERYAEYCLRVGRFVPGLGLRRFAASAIRSLDDSPNL
ncbi:isoprenylcysteine carboxylmethyltransferase family protein [Polyangium sp. 15x6]|uniref:methyltransferase family protein n=1 Tax=Polyangium sp. 15x6 TaxID=3042687 RepID=UPI00249A8923|nr:isoprenylcysteine carboxylmethyltransferase family protein [Polyangium sp. 15x6]MDI3282161.1 isoprenylcysteine carboxylmethyltransferase family protein [Polyangium sp. 15x6]